MDYKQFKKQFIREQKSGLIVGKVLLLPMAIVSFICLFVFYEGISTTSSFWWLIGNIAFLLITLGLIRSSNRELTAIKKDKHPVLNAIKSGDKSFVVWVYIGMSEGASTTSSSPHLNIICRTGHITSLSGTLYGLGACIPYLRKEFPDAYIGWNPEIRDEMKTLIDNSKDKFLIMGGIPMKGDYKTISGETTI